MINNIIQVSRNSSISSRSRRTRSDSELSHPGETTVCSVAFSTEFPVQLLPLGFLGYSSTRITTINSSPNSNRV